MWPIPESQGVSAAIKGVSVAMPEARPRLLRALSGRDLIGDISSIA